MCIRVPGGDRTNQEEDSGSSARGLLDKMIRLCGWVAICVRLR